MDISALQGNPEFTVEITHPVTGLPAGPKFVIEGIYTDAFNSAVRDHFLRGETGDPLQSKRVLAAVTKDIKDADEKGVPLERDQAERIYTEYPLIHRQVLNAFRDQRNFFPMPVT